MEAEKDTVRAFAGEEDFWRLREFLVTLWPLTPPGRTWDVRRWDGSYCYASEPGLVERRAARTRYWEDSAGRIVAALMTEGGPEVYPHVHPDARHLEGEVVALGERLASDLGDESVIVPCYRHDAALRRVLEVRGYECTPGWCVIRRLVLGSGPLPEPSLPPGYRMRTTRPDDADHQRLADLLNAAFGRDFHYAGETRGFQARAPSFRRSLDLVAEASDGSFAAYAAVCWDSANRHGIFEPVCTHPQHRHRGLAKALMREGIRRARSLGALGIDVETGQMEPANALYESMGFGEVYYADMWQKQLAGR